LRLNKATMKKTTHKTGVRNKADQNIFETVGLMGKWGLMGIKKTYQPPKLETK